VPPLKAMRCVQIMRGLSLLFMFLINSKFSLQGRWSPWNKRSIWLVFIISFLSARSILLSQNNRCGILITSGINSTNMHPTISNCFARGNLISFQDSMLTALFLGEKYESLFCQQGHKRMHHRSTNVLLLAIAWLLERQLRKQTTMNNLKTTELKRCCC
jgi:hypothetical protein